MAAGISEDESQQLLQTVEMFEAIAESQPDDYQSLEILKEAYAKLGRNAERLAASKRLAKAYAKLGQPDQALIEYQEIAKEYPNDPEVQAALKELVVEPEPAAPVFGVMAPSLAEHSKPTSTAGGPAGAPPPIIIRARPEDGDLALVNVLSAEKIVTPQAVDPLLAKLRLLRTSADKTQPLTLLPLVANEQLARLEDLMVLIVEKSRLPYMPLGNYEADRDCIRLLPEDVLWQHCLAPFDVISLALLIATANPFDMALRKQVEATVKFHVFWYISPPAEILATIRRSLGLDRNQPGEKK